MDLRAVCAYLRAFEKTALPGIPRCALASRGALPQPQSVIQRYSRPEMRAIWSEENKLSLWLDIEEFASEALVTQGVVPKKIF